MFSQEDFIQNLYGYTDEQMKEIYGVQTEDKKSLFDEIGSILLAYTIIDSVLKLTKIDQNGLYNKLSKKILSMFRRESKLTEKKVTNILKDTLKKSNDFYNKDSKDDFINKDAEKIISKRYKGSTFSKRIWDNNDDISKELHQEIEDFLKGKVNVNEIKKNIEDKFNTSKFNASRVVESEVSRVHDEYFRKYCKDNGIDTVIYKATFCNTCKVCGADHNKVFKLEDVPKIPRHPFCKCYLSYDLNYLSKDTSEEKLNINLQLFAYTSDKTKIIEAIKNGYIDKTIFNQCYDTFNDKFKNGIKTPLETINNRNDRFYHIIVGHPEFMNPIEIDRIVQALSNPDCIKEAVDKNGRKSHGYLKEFNGKTLLIIAKNDIITAYYPGKNYLKNKISTWRLIWDEKF
ncbi:MAG: minor capsid protein [Bacilli bacterium]